LKYLSALCPALFAAAAIALSGCSGETLDNPVLLSKAADAGAKGDWQTAKTLAQKAVKHDPNDGDALVMLSISLENTGDVDSALDEASKAVKVADKSFMAQYTKGRLLYLKGKYDACIAPLKLARAIRPDSLDAVVLLAQAATNQNLPEAAGYYSIVAKSDRFKNRPEPWNELGVYFFARRDFKKAFQYFARAEALSSDNASVALNLAILNDAGLAKPAEALSYYKKYLALTRKNPELDAKRKAVEARIGDLAGR